MKPVLLNGDARGHGVAAAFFRNASLNRATHGRPDIDAGDRTRRARRFARALVLRENEARALKTLSQAARGEPDKAFMPGRRACDDDGASGILQQSAVSPGSRFLDGFQLDLPAFAVELVESFSDPSCLCGVVRGKQSRTKPGVRRCARLR